MGSFSSSLTLNSIDFSVRRVGLRVNACPGPTLPTLPGAPSKLLAVVAILYVRQSSPYQALNNLESQKLQYAM
jgi:hypothetical protein